MLAFPARHSLGQAAAPETLAAQEAVVGLFGSGCPLGVSDNVCRPAANGNAYGDMEVAVFHDPERGLSAAWFRMVRGEPIESSGTATGTVADDLTTITRSDLATGVAVGETLRGSGWSPGRLEDLVGRLGRHAPNAQVYSDGH